MYDKTDKQLEDLIDKTYRIKNAASVLERQGLSRLDMLKKASQEQCVDGCNGTWLTSTNEVLTLNKIHPILYANAIRELLTQGRGEWRNVFIHGTANCAKTFMLKPIEEIYQCFINPAKEKYAWVGADKAEVIILQDFRFDSEKIAWKCLLLLREGESVKLPAPKNHYSKDVHIMHDVPIFTTSKDRIKNVGPNNTTDDKEDHMMNVRWKIFHFTHEFQEDEQKEIKACGSCFAKLALEGYTD